MYFLGVKIDVVRSRRVAEREKLQTRLLAAATQANERFQKVIRAKFVVTHGDELQGLLNTNAPPEFTAILEHFHDAVSPYRLRFGIGFGSVSTQIHEFAIGTDGPVWYHAKAAVDEAARARLHITFRGLDPVDEAALGGLANLMLWMRTRFSKEQQEVVSMIEAGATQSEAAKALAISPAAVSKRLDAAGWRHYREARDAVAPLLTRATAPHF